MGKIISGIREAKAKINNLYKTVFIIIMLGFVISLMSMVGVISGIITMDVADKFQAFANFANAIALSILAYNAKVTIKSNNLAITTGILALVVAALAMFSLLK